MVTHRHCSWMLIAAFLTNAILTSAHAQRRDRPPATFTDLWSEPAQGLRYLRRITSTPAEIHVLQADLRVDGVRVAATPYRSRWGTISERANVDNVEVVVNGGFWSTLQRPCGLAAGDGEVWENSALDPSFGTFVLDTDGQAHLYPPTSPPTDTSRIAEAVSGRPMLVTRGEVDDPTLTAFPSSGERAPRTAVGLSRDRRTLYLVVVDGRQRSSRGMDLFELADLLRELGAYDAMNLDGGASSQMFVRHLGGIVNVPARGRWEAAVDEYMGTGDFTRSSAQGTEVFVRGREQEVINHLVLYARPFDVPVVPATSSLGGLVPVAAPPPLPPRVRLGTSREVLAPVLAVGLPTLTVLLLAVRLATYIRNRRRLNGRLNTLFRGRAVTSSHPP